MSLYHASDYERQTTGTLVRMARAVLHLTQAEFGRRSHYTGHAVNAWETGRVLAPLSIRRECLRIVKAALRDSVELEAKIQEHYSLLGYGK